MKKIILSLFFILFLSVISFACGERDVKLVDGPVTNYETQTKKSACSKVNVETNRDNVVLVEKDRIKIDQHKAQHILEDYLLEDYNGKVVLVNDDHSDVPGHEHHHHAKGNLQDSHGTISYAFLVRGNEDFYNGKSIPLYVDAESGEVYGVGCGYGAGKVVYTPENKLDLLDKFLHLIKWRYTYDKGSNL